MLQGRSWLQTLQVDCLTLPAHANISWKQEPPALRLKHGASESQSILALAQWMAGRACSRFLAHAAARSDHLLIVAAFSAWDAARREHGRQAAFQAGCS